jgi:hypothetical protein
MFDEKYEVHPEIAREFPPDNPPMPDPVPVQAKPEPQPRPQQQVVPEVEEEIVQVEPAPIPQYAADTAKSWRELRLARERAERERDDALRLLQMQQHKPQVQEQPEPDIDLDDDSYVAAKHLKAYSQKIKKLEQQVQMQQQQNHAETARLRLKSKYSDFDSVVNPDTIEMLKVLQPEVARTLDQSSDLYASGVTAYMMIKNMNLQPQDMYKDDISRIQKNANKPKPSVSISPQKGESPLTAANAFSNGLTEELKTQLLKEMQEARRGY